MKNILAYLATLLKPYGYLMGSMAFFALSIIVIFLLIHLPLSEILEPMVYRSVYMTIFSFLCFLTFFLWYWLFALFKTPLTGHGSFAHYRHVVDKNWMDAISTICAKDQFIRGTILLTLSSIFSIVFTMGKSFIYIFNDYTLDPWLIDLERLVHFGHLPTVAMMTITPSPAVNEMILRFLDVIYSSWFYMVPASIAYVCYVEDNEKRRLHFLWAKFFLWIVGGIFVAMIFASAGPVFVHQKYPEMLDPYADFLAYFAALDAKHAIVAQYGQAMLTSIMIEDHSLIKINAMSAMPSMHVAVCWLVLLYIWQFKSTLKYAMLAYTIFMLFGSFTLGWHYAIDGYVGIIIASIVWYAVGRGLHLEQKKSGQS
jgi:hypothetical protein